jgi:uncharacterized protein (TIGR00730 family)
MRFSARAPDVSILLLLMLVHPLAYCVMTTRPGPNVKNQFVDGRIRAVNAEFEGLKKFCVDLNMRGTFLFFGSARAKSTESYPAAVAEMEAIVADPHATEAAKAKARSELKKLEPQQWMTVPYEGTRVLARLLTEWARSEEGVHTGLNVMTNFPECHGSGQPLVVCTGGGPGFMEAANQGAMEAKGVSAGIGVELPFETRLNDYVTHGFTCTTFYARKYWEVFCAKAMIVCPGGVGTNDEMFEVLTLMQCGKMPKIPVVLFGKEFWTRAVDLRYMASTGVMSYSEIDALCVTDDPQEAFEFISNTLKNEAQANLNTI